jgi:hypothetical protein
MRLTTIPKEQAQERIAPSQAQIAQAPFVEAVKSLTDDHCLELRRDEGETMRGLKLRLSRASATTSIPICYGESSDDPDALIVWLDRQAPVRTRS